MHIPQQWRTPPVFDALMAWTRHDLCGGALAFGVYVFERETDKPRIKHVPEQCTACGVPLDPTLTAAMIQARLDAHDDIHWFE
jgi:hypothetical protein